MQGIGCCQHKQTRMHFWRNCIFRKAIRPVSSKPGVTGTFGFFNDARPNVEHVYASGHSNIASVSWMWTSQVARLFLCVHTSKVKQRLDKKQSTGAAVYIAHSIASCRNCVLIARFIPRTDKSKFVAQCKFAFGVLDSRTFQCLRLTICIYCWSDSTFKVSHKESWHPDNVRLLSLIYV